MRRLRKCSLAIGVVLALILVGCGGGGETTAKPALTKQQFIHQAHAICYRFSKKQVREMEAFRKKHGFDAAEPTQHEQEMVNTAVVPPVVQEKVDALRALPAPEGDEAKIETILKLMEKGNREAKAHPEQLAHSLSPSYEKAGQLIAAYGVWLCAQP